MLTSTPAKPGFTYSRRFRKRIMRRLQQTTFDLLALNGSDLLWILPWLPPSTRCILVAHNLEHLLFASQAELVERKFPFLAAILRLERERLERWETERIRTVGNVLFLSHCDAKYSETHSLSARTIVVPPLFIRPPAPRISSGVSPLLNVGFLGNMTWWPNRQGLLWFLKCVFPKVQNRMRLHLFGVDTERVAGEHPNIVKHGEVADLERVWRHCDLMICPIFHGGGVCVKLAEALYNGVPVLATNFATRGLPLQNDPCLIILDHEGDWSEFLASQAATELRSRRVSPQLSNRFAVAGHLDTVHQFLTGTLATDGIGRHSGKAVVTE